MTTPVFRILRDVIGNEGPISVERYMELVLHHPDHGYYRQGNPLGAQGDFITAPEVSQLFGEMVAVWCVEMWGLMGKPDPFVLLELGPGRGTLMADILKSTAKVTDFQRALRLRVLECNAKLRALQMEKFGDYAPVYLESLEQIPHLPVIALANEFFDTIPMRQYVKTESGWRERLVDYSGEKLVFVEGEVQPGPYHPELDRQLKEGWFYEVSPQSLACVKTIADHIARYGGAGLIVDYGYAVPAGEDTLFAMRHHKHVDPLDDAGNADVTHDVDFMAFKMMIEREGLRTEGPLGQGAFLKALGLDVRVAQLMHHAAEDLQKTIQEDLQRLIDPARMGTMFKALAMVAPSIKDVPGFL